MIATDKEQSKRVLACGILGSTADMCWRKNKINPTVNDLIARPPFWEEDIPAWSLSLILSFMPPTITIDKDEDSEPLDYNMLLYPYGNQWEVMYTSYDGEWSRDLFPGVYAETPIEACVKAIEKLTREGYKLRV